MARDWDPDKALDQAASSVSRKRLLGTKRCLFLRPLQRLGLVRGWLYKQPYFEYFEEDEALQFLFRISSPIFERTAEQTHQLTPGRRYSTLIGLTNQRILIVIGQRPENDQRSIFYENVDGFSIAPERDIFVMTRRPREPEVKPVKIRITLER